MFIMSLRVVTILSLLEICRAYTPAANPPMLSHASMDVGNIISIVIPESPDENINVEQLTGEFRQQLERIKKQSRASKVEHGLVTLKRVLPEMSREEKRKTLPLIRRVLHGRRVANSGSMRNWTREASRGEQMREGGQFVRSRSAGNPEERRIYRDYEESGNREAVTTRIDHLAGDKDEYRQVNERTYANRREEAPREDAIRRSDQNRQEELIHHEDPGHREDRITFPEEDSSSSKIPLSGSQQDWNNQNWEDQSRGDSRIYPETSTVDCSYKLDRAVRQKDPTNEILQSERYNKLVRLPELRVNVPEEPNVDCTMLDQQITSGHAFSREESADNLKRHTKDSRTFDLADVPGFVNYPRVYDINGASSPDCDSTKRNSSSGSRQSLKDDDGNKDVSFDERHQGAMNFASPRASQRTIQNPREQYGRLNASGFENVVSGSVDDYAIKKFRGPSYSEEFQGLPLVKSSPGNGLNRWNIPSFDNRQFNNSSDDFKNPPSVYEMFGGGGFRVNFDSEPKMAASQPLAIYGSDGHVLRIQRSVNETYYRNQTELDRHEELSSNITERDRQKHEHQISKSIFERLKRLFGTPSLPKVIYNRVIILYDNQSESHNEKTGEAFTEAGKTQTPTSPSMIEPTSSTSHEVPVVLRSTTDSPQSHTTQDFIVKPHTSSESY